MSIIKSKKRIRTIRFILFAAFYVFLWVICCNNHFAFAQSGGSYSTNKELAVGLKALRESADEMVKRNNWLSSESEALQKEMKYLGAEHIMLEGKKGDSFAKKEVVDINKRSDYIKFGETLEVLDKERSERKYQENELNNLVAKAKNEISRLKSKISNISGSGEIIKLHEQMIEFERLIKQSENNLFIAQKELEQLKNKKLKPVRRVDGLKDKNNSFKQRMVILKDELEIARVEKESLQSDLDNVEQYKKDRLSQLDEKISKLEDRERELESIVSKAEKKLGGSRLDFVENTQQEDQLEEDLKLLLRENSALKKRITTLEEKNKK